MDDSIICLRDIVNCVHELRDVLLSYERVPGHKVNFQKSLAFFSLSIYANRKGFLHATLDVTRYLTEDHYLGFSWLLGRQKVAQLEFIVEKVSTHLTS